MLPATAGLTAAVVIFVVLMGFLAPLQADNSDVPLMLHTAPQLQQSAFGSTLDSINDDSLVIEAYVDSQGRVQDYRILSDSKEDKALLPQVKKNMLIFTTFTTFRPALSMGRPTTGRAILSFSRVSVRGVLAGGPFHSTAGRVVRDHTLQTAFRIKSCNSVH